MGSRSLSKVPIIFLYHAITFDNRARNRNTTVEEKVGKETDNFGNKNSTEKREETGEQEEMKLFRKQNVLDSIQNRRLQ